MEEKDPDEHRCCLGTCDGKDFAAVLAEPLQGRARRSKLSGMEFGEKVLLRRHPSGGRLAKLSSMWEDGIFLGVRSVSAEMNVVQRCRSLANQRLCSAEPKPSAGSQSAQTASEEMELVRQAQDVACNFVDRRTRTWETARLIPMVAEDALPLYCGRGREPHCECCRKRLELPCKGSDQARRGQAEQKNELLV